MPRPYEDLTGKTINGVKVLRIVDGIGGAGIHKKWVCECPMCGKEYITQQNHIKQRKLPFCVECVNELREDLVGKKYGHLTVDRMIPQEKYKRTLCSCTCDCGATEIIVQANHLKNGETKSCGCLKSYPEEQIATILTNNKIVFEREKKFSDLKYKNKLRFDFYLPEINLVIEYNGKQHYEHIDYYGNEDDFKIAQLRDRIKQEYCVKNNINYLVIRYDEDIEEVLIANNIIMKR